MAGCDLCPVGLATRVVRALARSTRSSRSSAPSACQPGRQLRGLQPAVVDRACATARSRPRRRDHRRDHVRVLHEPALDLPGPAQVDAAPRVHAVLLLQPGRPGDRGRRGRRRQVRPRTRPTSWCLNICHRVGIGLGTIFRFWAYRTHVFKLAPDADRQPVAAPGRGRRCAVAEPVAAGATRRTSLPARTRSRRVESTVELRICTTSVDRRSSWRASSASAERRVHDGSRASPRR